MIGDTDSLLEDCDPIPLRHGVAGAKGLLTRQPPCLRPFRGIRPKLRAVEKGTRRDALLGQSPPFLWSV